MGDRLCSIGPGAGYNTDRPSVTAGWQWPSTFWRPTKKNDRQVSTKIG